MVEYAEDFAAVDRRCVHLHKRRSNLKSSEKPFEGPDGMIVVPSELWLAVHARHLFVHEASADLALERTRDLSSWGL